MSYIIGIDNGVTGSIAILSASGTLEFHQALPVKSEQSYTKTKQNITRADVPKVREILDAQRLRPHCNNLAVIERPMINPGRFKATLSAMRCLEATLIVLEEFGIPYRYIDSKEWQKEMLPKGCEKDELKAAAVDIAQRLFPAAKATLVTADSLLIAEYARRTYK